MHNDRTLYLVDNYFLRILEQESRPLFKNIKDDTVYDYTIQLIRVYVNQMGQILIIKTDKIFNQ